MGTHTEGISWIAHKLSPHLKDHTHELFPGIRISGRFRHLAPLLRTILVSMVHRHFSMWGMKGHKSWKEGGQSRGL